MNHHHTGLPTHPRPRCLFGPLWFAMLALGLILPVSGVCARQAIITGDQVKITRRNELVKRLESLGGNHLQFLPLTAEERATFAPSPAVLAIVDRLDNPDFLSRERALAELLQTIPEVKPLYAILDRDDLSPEQRNRLLRVVSHHLLSTARGALGISMNWRPESPRGPAAVLITDLIPGLPAEEVLEIGDRITAVDGRPLQSNRDLVMIVQNRQPGEVVVLTVMRPLLDDEQEMARDEQGEVILETREVPLELGSADLLYEIRPDNSPLNKERREKARVVVQYYENPVRPIPFLNGDEKPFLIPEPEFSPEFVDRHRDLGQLRNQLRLLERGAFEETEEALRRSWRIRLKVLQEAARQPGLSDYDRVYREKVAARFAELLPD